MNDAEKRKVARQTVEEAWAIHDFLQRIGFDTDDIYLHGNVIDDNGNKGVGVMLKAQGKEMVFVAGRQGVDHSEQFVNMWLAFIKKHNEKKISMEERERIVAESWIGSHFIAAINKMREKGFELDIPWEVLSVFRQVDEAQKKGKYIVN